MPPNDFLSSGLIGALFQHPALPASKAVRCSQRVVFGAIRSDTNWCEPPEFATDTQRGGHTRWQPRRLPRGAEVEHPGNAGRLAMRSHCRGELWVGPAGTEPKLWGYARL
jgi:hypothetical protein